MSVHVVIVAGLTPHVVVVTGLTPHVVVVPGPMPHAVVVAGLMLQVLPIPLADFFFLSCFSPLGLVIG